MSASPWTCWLYNLIFMPLAEIKDFSNFEITYRYNDVGGWQVETNEEEIKNKNKISFNIFHLFFFFNILYSSLNN